MSYDINDLRARVRTFIQDELLPLEREWGLHMPGEPPRLRYETRITREQAQQIWKRSAAAGLYSATLPTSLGGPGLSVHDTCLLKMEAAEHGSMNFGHVLGDLGGPPRAGSIMKFATPAQNEEFFIPVLRGERACCFAMTEPQSGSDALSIRTSAVREGDHYVLNGHKHYISATPFADFAIVMCVTDPTLGADGISALLVDLNAPGVEITGDYRPMHGLYIDEDILFHNVRVPVANVLGQEGQGFRIGMARVSINRLLHTPSILGVAKSVYRMSLDYAARRQQFGGPIARFQAIQHMLADMATDLFACEAMMLEAARRIDAGAEGRMESSMCKVFIAEKCFQVADRAVQIHGNVGVTKDHPVEWAFRMLRVWRINSGTSEIQRNTIAKAILEPFIPKATA